MRARTAVETNGSRFPDGDDSTGPEMHTLRVLVRVLAREAAREAFAQTLAEPRPSTFDRDDTR